MLRILLAVLFCLALLTGCTPIPEYESIDLNGCTLEGMVVADMTQSDVEAYLGGSPVITGSTGTQSLTYLIAPNGRTGALFTRTESWGAEEWVLMTREKGRVLVSAWPELVVGAKMADIEASFPGKITEEPDTLLFSPNGWVEGGVSQLSMLTDTPHGVVRDYGGTASLDQVMQFDLGYQLQRTWSEDQRAGKILYAISQPLSEEIVPHLYSGEDAYRHIAVWAAANTKGTIVQVSIGVQTMNLPPE